MDHDDVTETLPSDEPSRRAFAGIGRGPAALLVAAGLLIGGGTSVFMIANASSTVTTLASSTPGASHTCPAVGRSTAN